MERAFYILRDTYGSHSCKLSVCIRGKFKTLRGTGNEKDCVAAPSSCRNRLVRTVIKKHNGIGRIVGDQFRVPHTCIDFPTAIETRTRLMGEGASAATEAKADMPRRKDILDRFILYRFVAVAFLYLMISWS